MSVKNSIKKLFTKYGKNDYIGENISQTEHMIQAAMLAERGNEDDEIIIAAFLHDIGQLVGFKLESKGNKYGIINHEQLGYNYLRDLGFVYPIPDLVFNHIKAKKYLTKC